MRHFATLACLVALISGCTDTDPSGITQTNIRSYSVTGTDGVVSSPGQQTTQAQINMNENNGVFSVAWNAESVTTTTLIRLFITSDNQLDETDAEILEVACGEGSALCPGATANAIQCTFDTDVTITCGSGDAAQATELSTYFASASGLPGNYLLALQACDQLEQDCRLVGTSVRFQ